MSEPQNLTDKRYAPLFDTAQQVDTCLRFLLGELNQRQIKLFDLATHQRVFLFILTRSLKTYASIVLLCRNGYGQDASALLRSLLENIVTVEFILYDKKKADDLAKRFVAYKWVIMKRHLAEQEQQLATMSAAQMKEYQQKRAMILAKVEEFKKNFRVISDRALVTWSGKTVRDMARQVDKQLLAEYDTTFRLCSRFSHPSILGDQEYMVQDGKQLVFSPLPSDIGLVLNLHNAVKYALRLARVINDLFGFAAMERIKMLEQQVQQIFQGEISAPAAAQNKNGQAESPAHSIRESVIVFKTESSSL